MSDDTRRGGPDHVRDAAAAVMAAAEAIQVSDEELARYEAEIARAARRERLRDSGIYSSITAEDVVRLHEDSLEPTAALSLVQRWVASIGEARKAKTIPRVRVLVVLGTPGTGKTVAAAWAVAREAGRYVQFDDLVRSYHAPFNPDRKPYFRARGAAVLIVDEVPVEASDARTAMLRDLIDHRQRGQLTLFLGNCSAAQWDAHSDERMTQRLGPMTFVRWVKGQSMRKPIDGGRLPDRSVA